MNVTPSNLFTGDSVLSNPLAIEPDIAIYDLVSDGASICLSRLGLLLSITLLGLWRSRRRLAVMTPFMARNGKH